MAHVVGPPNEEIYCDEWGRVKIQFPWDRYGKYNDLSSCWIRVAQNWAGGTWGHIAIPRIGHEVIVDFLEGDPDQPIVTGRTYHTANPPPYPLPMNKTRMTIKSNTHKGKGFNELRFEDQANKEEIFIHAQKDQNIKVLNNRTKAIDNNQVEHIGHNKQIEVKNNHDEVIGGNMTLSVGPSHIGKIINDALAKVAAGIGSAAQSLGLPGLLNPGEGNMSVIVEKNKQQTIGIAYAQQVGVAKTTMVGVTQHNQVGKNKSAKVGKDYSVDVGEKMLIEAGEEITFKTGDSTIHMKSDGTIVLRGKDVQVIGD